MTQKNSKAKKYELKALIELGLVFVLMLALTALVTLYHTKMTNQLYVHIITFVTGMIFFTLAYIKVFSIDLRKPEYVESRKESRLSFFNYLVETGFKSSVVKILAMLVAFFSFYVLFMLWFGSEEFAFNYHKIKTLVVAFAIAIAFSPDVEITEAEEAQVEIDNNNSLHTQNNSSIQSPVKPESPGVSPVKSKRKSILPNRQEHKIEFTKTPADLAEARERLANADQPMISKQEEGESLYETYAPNNEDEIINLLDAGLFMTDSFSPDVVHMRDGVEYYRTSGAKENVDKLSAGMKWLLRSKHSHNLENKLLQLLDDTTNGNIKERLLKNGVSEERIKYYDKGPYQFLRVLVLFTMKPEHCKNFLDYCIEHKAEVSIEERVVAYAISVQNETHKEKYAQVFPDVSCEEDSANEKENALYLEAIKEFSDAGIINYPTPAEIYDIEENHALNEEQVFSDTLKVDRDLFGYLLVNSPYLRKYDGKKPNVFNEELLYKAIQLCASDLKIEGAWEENSETPDATLHWIVDDTYYTCESNEEHLAGFDWQIPMANYALETMGLKGKVFSGHGEDFKYIWFFDPDVLCPLLDKYKIRYFVEEWKA